MIEILASVAIAMTLLAGCIPLLFRLTQHANHDAANQPTPVQLLEGIARRDVELATHSRSLTPDTIELITMHHVAPCDAIDGACVIQYTVEVEGKTTVLTRSESPISATDSGTDQGVVAHANDKNLLTLEFDSPIALVLEGSIPSQENEKLSMWDSLSPHRALRFDPVPQDAAANPDRVVEP